MAEGNPYQNEIDSFEAENTALREQRDALLAALNLIRFNWAGHSRACATALHTHGKCDCDWPLVRDKCDDAIALTEQS